MEHEKLKTTCQMLNTKLTMLESMKEDFRNSQNLIASQKKQIELQQDEISALKRELQSVIDINDLQKAGQAELTRVNEQLREDLDTVLLSKQKIYEQLSR